MESDELHRLDLLGFDERTESWYLDTRDTRRLPLDRRTLDGLVQLYNSIHRGGPMVLVDQRELQRLEESNHRLSGTIRDLYLRLDREQHVLYRRILAACSRLLLAAGAPRRRLRR